VKRGEREGRWRRDDENSFTAGWNNGEGKDTKGESQNELRARGRLEGNGTRLKERARERRAEASGLRGSALYCPSLSPLPVSFISLVSLGRSYLEEASTRHPLLIFAGGVYVAKTAAVYQTILLLSSFSANDAR